MPPVSNLPDQKTPARPVELNFAAETGVPSANQEVLLIGHAAAGTAASGLGVVRTINNSGDAVAALAETTALWGADSELTKMVQAAIKANQDDGHFVALKAIALTSTATDLEQTLTAVERVKAEYVVSPYNGQDSTLRDALKASALAMSGPHNPSNNQFGTFGVVFNRDEADPSSLDKFDTKAIIGLWLPDSGTPDKSIGEMAAACAAKMAGNGAPFNPLDDVTINGVDAPADDTDWPTVGLGKESESALNQGWTPLKVKPNGEVAFVRTVTGRISNDGSGTPVVQAYYDVQDFNVLYLWRKTLYTRFSQPDFKRRKASAEAAREIRAEAIRLASLFEDQGMFQAVAQLSKQFVVERSSSDRHRFNIKTPVNVIPGLHVIASNIEATTQFDELSI
jgi:phage tail sheath gpL-like